MTWIRYFSRKLFGPYLPYVAPKTAEKWMAVMRIAYFFSASTLLFYGLKKIKEIKKETALLGKPLIEDHSPAHKKMRESGVETGLIIETIGGTTRFIDYNREEYYQQLEREALERAKIAQEEVLARGEKLPSDAIRLVDKQTNETN